MLSCNCCCSLAECRRKRLLPQVHSKASGTPAGRQGWCAMLSEGSTQQGTGQGQAGQGQAGHAGQDAAGQCRQGRGGQGRAL